MKTIFTELNDLISISPCSNKTFYSALHANFDDLEDALLYQIALENKLDYFITNDLSLIKKLSSTTYIVNLNNIFIIIVIIYRRWISRWFSYKQKKWR